MMIKPGAYVLKQDTPNPRPDRRHVRDWRKFPVWREGSEFVVKEMRDGNLLDEEYMAGLPAETQAKIQAARIYTIVEAVGDRWPSLHRVGPGDEERYAALAAALVPCDEETHDQFLTRIDCRGEQFASWLLEAGHISRADFERLWHQFNFGEP